MAFLGCPRRHTVALETYRLNPPRMLILEPERSVAVGFRDNSALQRLTMRSRATLTRRKSTK
jgi:hypothetical protein